uniref:Uncharacterized protein n=1 Tax=Anguilla anguilla TaxID=7936 RepID=A0A0E9XJI7_ANGAN
MSHDKQKGSEVMPPITADWHHKVKQKCAYNGMHMR